MTSRFDFLQRKEGSKTGPRHQIQAPRPRLTYRVYQHQRQHLVQSASEFSRQGPATSTLATERAEKDRNNPWRRADTVILLDRIAHRSSNHHSDSNTLARKSDCGADAQPRQAWAPRNLLLHFILRKPHTYSHI